MKKQILDYTLVPMGLTLMLAYHVLLSYYVIKYPRKTVMGNNAKNRQLWVRSMMKDMDKNGILAVQTLRNNIMASTLLASTAIMLSSLIVVLMTNGGHDIGRFRLVLGDTSELGFSIKYLSILVCFLVAFLMNVQSVASYSHASILINVPLKSKSGPNEYVVRAVDRGSYFSSCGMISLYLSFPLFLWIFGPIPMFICCFVMVFLLYFFDFSVDRDVDWDE
ncbi:uncharacterized protein LOC143859725 [Tasmannia lanceolata]|uniref:uncharacterized protein LOC143859725 n=1 Tax=Tasmannia lanceolata TaxID=3420 RepID=UPI0040642403